MAVALEDAKEDAPGSDGFAVLIGHEARKLMEMREIVSSPGSEELSKRDRAEIGVTAAAAKVIGLQIHGAQLRKAFGANGSKLIQQLGQGLALRFFALPFAVEGLEGLRLAVLKNHGGARNPVGVLRVDEMADDVECGPCALAFVREGPKFGQVTKKSVEDGGSAGEKSNGLF